MKPGKYVVFALDGERFGLPIERVERILQAQRVTRIPKTPEAVLGVFDLRGSTLPVVDSRTLLKLQEGTIGCFVVVSAGEQRIAMTADRVDCIIDFSAAEISFSDETQTFLGKEDDRLTMLTTPEQMIPVEIRAKATLAAA